MPTRPPTALPLASARWRTLKAHFDNAGVHGTDIASVPTLLRRWTRAVGTYAEEFAYEPLHESYLHQDTALDVSYAVIPHLVPHLKRLDVDRRAMVLDDIARVDVIRRVPRSRVEAAVRELSSIGESLRDLFIQNLRDRHPALPADLATAYLPAVAQAKKLAATAWGRHRSESMGPHRWRRHVRYLRDHGLTDVDIVFSVEALAQPDADGTAPVHAGGDAIDAALCDVVAAPEGFARRLRPRTEAGRRARSAMVALAWIAPHAPVKKMLGSGK